MRMCLLLAVLSLTLFITTIDCKKALILGGGGARGAFHLGVLEKACEGPERNTWDFIVGSSIGAMNGAILAQFNKDEICTKGVAALRSFWEGIKEEDDFYKSTSILSFMRCLNPLNYLTVGKQWVQTAGMCSASPAHKKMDSAINTRLLQASNVDFHFPVTSFHDTEHPVWLTKRSANMMTYLKAAMALPMLLPPIKIGGVYYTDGGVFTAIPLVKAIQLGATQLRAVVTFPEKGSYSTNILQAEKDEKMGPATIDYIYSVLSRNSLYLSDLRAACNFHQNTDIRVIYPTAALAGFTEFTRSEISKSRNHGRDLAARGFQPACVGSIITGSLKELSASKTAASTRKNNGSETNGLFIAIGIVVAGVVVGAFFVLGGFAINKKYFKRQPSIDFVLISGSK